MYVCMYTYIHHIHTCMIEQQVVYIYILLQHDLQATCRGIMSLDLSFSPVMGCNMSFLTICLQFEINIYKYIYRIIHISVCIPRQPCVYLCDIIYRKCPSFVYIYTYIYMHVYKYTHTHIYTCNYTYTHTHAYIYAHA